MNKQFPVLDLHCDTASEMLDGRSLYQNDGMLSIKKMREGAVFSQFFAIFIRLTEHKSPAEAHEHFLKIYRNLMEELNRNREHIVLARDAAGISALQTEGKIAAILTLEEGGILDSKPERLDELYGMGVRLITLTWNHENCFGFPNTKKPELMKKGLKPFGKEMVERMQEMGMIVDVSHLSDGGFWDVVKLSKKPFIASHSNARSIHYNIRNLTDEMLKALADAGGVTGINFYHKFLGDDKTGSIEQMVAHIKHIRKVAGIDTIAMGSDFDGFEGPCELADCSQFPLLTDALFKAGFSDEEIEKICWKNAMRVIEQLTISK